MARAHLHAGRVSEWHSKSQVEVPQGLVRGRGSAFRLWLCLPISSADRDLLFWT